MQIQWKTKRPYVFVCLFIYLFIYYCKDPAQTARMHMHMLIWKFGGPLFSWTPSLISCKYFFSTVKTKDLDQTAQIHMHAHVDLELCWSDVSWAHFTFHLSFFFFVVVF